MNKHLSVIGIALSLFFAVPVLAQQQCAELTNAKNRDACYDEIEIVRKLLVSAKKGDLKAQKALGYRYQEGDGVKKSKKESLYWYQKAADQGDMDSRIITGGVSDAEILDKLKLR